MAASAAPELPEWQQLPQALVTECRFTDFVAAVDFVQQLVAPAEALSHQPDLQLSYSYLQITVTTHDAGGLTPLDFALAVEISELSAGRCQPPS